MSRTRWDWRVVGRDRRGRIEVEVPNVHDAWAYVLWKRANSMSCRVEMQQRVEGRWEPFREPDVLGAFQDVGEFND